MATTRKRNTLNRAAVALPADIRLMNAVAAGVFVLAALVLLAAVVGWLVRAPLFTVRCDRSRRRTVAQQPRHGAGQCAAALAGNFFSFDLDARSRGVRIGALGAPGGGASGVAEPAGRDAGGAPCRSAVAGPGRTGPGQRAAGQQPGRGLRGQPRRCRGRSAGHARRPRRQLGAGAGAAAPAGRHAGADRRPHRDAEAVEPRARGAPSSTAVPSSNSAAAAKTRSWRAPNASRARCRKRRSVSPMPAAAAAADRRRPAPPRRLCAAPARRIDHRLHAAAPR